MRKNALPDQCNFQEAMPSNSHDNIHPHYGDPTSKSSTQVDTMQHRVFPLRHLEQVADPRRRRTPGHRTRSTMPWPGGSLRFSFGEIYPNNESAVVSFHEDIVSSANDEAWRTRVQNHPTTFLAARERHIEGRGRYTFVVCDYHIFQHDESRLHRRTPSQRPSIIFALTTNFIFSISYEIDALSETRFPH